jgi:undecaprenyl-diphosphatase
MFVAFGIVLYVVDRIAASRRRLDGVGVGDGLLMGVAQALALQPGVSRSGVTMTAARALGFDREEAARFAFLLALPAIAGAGVYEGADLVAEGLPDAMAGPFLAGIVASAASGFAVIAFLLRYLRRHDFAIFLWYRVAVALLAFGVIAAGVRPGTL